MGRKDVTFHDLAEHDVTSPVLASLRREPTSVALTELLDILHDLVNARHH
jgi:hemerythrin superfamily protein